MSQVPEEALTFEQGLARLEQIVRELEDGRTGLDDALARYEQGVQLLRGCYEQLRHAEQRILLVTGESADGQPIVRPFEHSASADGDKPDRGRRPKADEPENLF